MVECGWQDKSTEAAPVWATKEAKAHYDNLLHQIDECFKVPREMRGVEPHIFHSWFYGQQRKAAHLRIEAGTLFLSHTSKPE